METAGLQGGYGVDQGFAALLAGTGLEAVRRADGDYLLQRVDGQQATQLAPVVVLGAGATTEGTGLYTADWMRSANGLVLSQRETPQSVTVVTRQRMDDEDMRSLTDVMASTPGISVQNFDSERYSFNSRGFGVSNYMYDGIPTSFDTGYAAGESSVDPIIYDRVEVVRGATGLLTGAGNPSASINLRRHVGQLPQHA
ncbi:hypothetical protein G6F68_012999 [Rhizopus microsporus]|nr:hypothetical protein G6F68_012999 [Rhizopus microsporus]